MIRTRAVSLGVLIAWLASAGCMSLREVPRSQYAARTERKAVRVETVDGLVYEFDWASVDRDTLVGYRNHGDSEGALEQVAVVHVPLQDVSRLTARELDWRRTGMIGGGVVAAALAVGLRAALKGNTPSTPTSGTGKPFTGGVPRGAGN